MRDGIRGHSGRAAEPATLEGQDRAPRRPHRLHQPRHRRRGAGRRDHARRTCRAARSRCSATAAASGSTRSCTTSSSTPTRAGDDRPGRAGRRRDGGAARVHVRARLPRRRGDAASTPRSTASIRALFDHYCAHPRARSPISIPDGELGRRVTDHIAGMTDRFCIAQFEALSVPVGVRAVSRYTADSRDRVRDAVDMVALVESKVELRRAGVNSYFGCCPFHDERTPVVPRQPRREALPLLRLLGVGRPVRLRDADRGPRLQGRARVARRPLRRRRWRPRRRIPAAARGARAARAACTLLSRARHLLRALPVGCARGAGRARVPRSGAASARQTLREFRVGYAPSAWDRMLLASRQAGYSDEELLAAGLAQRSQHATRDRSTTASAGGSCSRPLTRAGACAASARATMGEDQRPEVPQHPGRASSTTSARCCTGSISARASAARAGRDDPRRGLHRRARAASGRASATRSGSWARR